MPVYIVRSNEVGKCVEKVIDDLNAKLWAMNQRGHFVEMPEELAFDMQVVEEWEAIQSTDRQEAITSEIEGGFSTETRKSKEAGTDSSQENRQSVDKNSHVNKGKTVTTTKGS